MTPAEIDALQPGLEADIRVVEHVLGVTVRDQPAWPERAEEKWYCVNAGNLCCHWKVSECGFVSLPFQPSEHERAAVELLHNRKATIHCMDGEYRVELFTGYRAVEGKSAYTTAEGTKHSLALAICRALLKAKGAS